jgi:DNA-binding GntR family transcriptional regulator
MDPRPTGDDVTEVRPARSLSQAVLVELRAEILAGRHAPGVRLSPRTLATRFEVSLSVVREALNRLTEQGLVSSEAQLGFSVVRIDLDDIRDTARVRILIEGTALRDAVQHADVEYEARVLASHHRLSRTPGGQPGLPTSEEWAIAHAEFHATLISAAPSPRLRDLASGLRDMSELSRRWSESFVDHEVVRDVAGEHRALTAAVLAHDAELAVSLLTDHILRTADRLAEVLEATDGVPAPRGVSRVAR